MTTFGNENEAAAHAARIRAGVVALAAGTLIFGGKLLAWRMTGSAAVLSDALESIINVVAAGGLLFSLVVASWPADESHPYGHGKVEFFSAGVEGACIAGAALAIFWEAAAALVRGARVENIDLGVGVLVLASLVNAGLGWYLVRVGRRFHSLALVADGKHVITDVVTSAGVVAGLVAVRITDLHVLDPLVAMGVAVNILFTGWRLVRQAVGGLMDEADLPRLDLMVAALEGERRSEWIDVHGLRGWRSGRVQHADVHITVPRYLEIERAHAFDEEIGRIFSRATGLPTEAIVHFDPCRPRHCSGCSVSACPVRAAAFVARTPLSLQDAIRIGRGTLEPVGDALIALGSNLGDRAARLRGALDALDATPGTELITVSAFYETDPVGPAPQGPYLNAAARLRTVLSPRDLLGRLQEIEAAAGRVRGPEKNAARSLDLDLLLYGELQIDEAGLTVPHPRLHERAFVLEPLAEIAADAIHPVLGERIDALAARVRNPAAVRRLSLPPLRSSPPAATTA